MFKKIFILLVLPFCFSCSWEEEAPNPAYLEPPCPLITLEDTDYTVMVQHKDAFQISLVGYYGDCHMSNKKHHSYAIIQPIFMIRRLEATEQTNVPFDFYVEAVQGPTSGQFYRHYHEIATIPEFDKEVRYVGRKVRVFLPEAVKYMYEMNLGLEIKPREQIYNNRYFDEHFDYSEDRFDHVF